MNPENQKIIEKLKSGNELFLQTGKNEGDVSLAIRKKTAEEGQHPYAIVITCSDSRVIPDAIFSAGIGELFVIRVAGNVLDNHQLGSIEYAFSHLDANLIVMLGHTKCGAISAAQHSHGTTDRYIKYIIEDITEAINLNKTNILVNKYYYLDKDYIPNNLEKIKCFLCVSGSLKSMDFTKVFQ